MKIDQLIERMRENGVKLPENGTGQNGRVIARDLEKALGDYFFSLKYADKPEIAEHCALRRSIIPMKSYRFDKLKEHEQQIVMQDGNNWVQERKYNGWRIVITYIPHSGFMFWSGNISDVDFLPKDYTKHILLEDAPNSLKYKNLYPCSLLIDAEGLAYGDIVTQYGLPAQNTLEAIGAVLGSSAERAIQMQREGASLEFPCFDALTESCISAEKPLSLRRNKLLHFLDSVHHNCNLPLRAAGAITHNKKTNLRAIWKSGEEGVVLKNLKAPYVSGGRMRNISIKLKRTMSGEIGDDLDAFITDYINTPEWTKRGLLGGVVLSVFLACNDKNHRLHEIATVTAMPDELRKTLTEIKTLDGEAKPCLKLEYYNKILVVDGQELSSRNRRIMHAKVDWSRGFRTDKSTSDCVLMLEEVEAEKF